MKINGNEVKADSIYYDNKNYFLISDIAKYMDKNISYETNSINLKDKNIIQAKHEVIQNDKALSVKGIIRYVENKVIEPDEGAKILLLPSNITKNEINENDIFLFRNGRDFDKMTTKNIFATKTDSKGNCEITNIPKGKYILIIVSNHAIRNATDPIDSDTAFLIKPIRNDINESETLLFRSNKYLVKEIDMVENKGVEIKCDF